MSNLKEKLLEKATSITNGNTALACDSSATTDSENDATKLNQSEIPRSLSIVPDFVITLNEAKHRISMLQEFVKEMMVPEVDYGIIPGCKKPTLYKAGAEKLCDIFGFSKQVDIVNRVEDWDKGIFHYEIKAILINKRTGFIEAEGIGCCNNKEKKYKDLPSFNMVNTVLKMAKKRALIDAVLSATRSSGLFTQDVEDLASMTPTEKSIESSQCTNAASNPPTPNEYTPSDTSAQNETNPKAATSKQLTLLQSIVSDKNIDHTAIKIIMKHKYNVENSRLLSCKQASDLIKYLQSFNPNI